MSDCGDPSNPFQEFDCLTQGGLLNLTCPDGFISDDTGNCVPINVNPFSDPIFQDPIQPVSPNPPSTITVPGPEGIGTVTVNNNITLAEQGVNAVTAAVKAGITDAANVASGIAKDTADEVTAGVSKVADAITTGVGSAISTLIDTLKAIGDFVAKNASALLSTITDNLGSIVGAVKDAVTAAIGPIASTLQSVIGEISQVNSQYIQPVVTAINSTISTIGALTTAIEKDLHDGLAGILSIPGDVANSLTSLDATLNRTVQQIADTNVAAINDSWKPMVQDTIGDHLKNVGDSLTGVTSKDVRTTTFSDHVSLPEPTLAQAGAATVDAIWVQLQSLITSLLSGGQSTIDVLKTSLAGVPFLAGDVVELPVVITAVAGGLIASAWPLFQFVGQQVAGTAGLSKLSPGDALAAYMRQFMDLDTLKSELKVNGWDDQRIQIMTDLQIALLDVATIVDMFHRGIVEEADLRANLLSHGFIPDDQDALISASYKLFDVAGATRAYLYGQVTIEQLQSTLKENRYSTEEQAAYTATLLKPEGVSDYIERLKRMTLYSNHLTQDTTFITPPDDAVRAAQSEGLSPQVAADAWLQQFQVPPLQQWLALYFRGVRTQAELYGAMDYYRVPQEWRDDYVRANQALIPYRAIPAMVAAGIIDDAYAKQQLQAHGYSLQDTEYLLAYTKVSKAATTANQASDLHSISVGAAKTAWSDGAITDLQYEDILKAHGYDDSAIALTLQVQKLEQEIADRKSTAQDVINEALAGYITNDQAAQQLANSNYTIAEQAKYIKQLRKAQVSNGKLPSLADLHKFWKAGIIQESDFRSALATLGYAQQWIDAYATLDAPAPTS